MTTITFKKKLYHPLLIKKQAPFKGNIINNEKERETMKFSAVSMLEFCLVLLLSNCSIST